MSEPWVSMAARGEPAVPLVKASTATSWGSMSTIGTDRPSPPVSSSSSPAVTASTSLTPTASRSRSSSAGGLSGLSGTTMAPTPSTAR